MKPWRGVIGRWITWAGLSCGVVTVALRSSAATIPVLAARGIEQYRKGDATVAIHFSGGRPASGVKVEINQTAHDFRFGNVFRPRHYTNLTYRARYLELFNFVELLEFNGGQYETVEGRPQLASRRGFIDGWCRQNGLTNFYAHMLVWTPQMDEARNGPRLPHWLFNLSPDEQYQKLKQRILRDLTDYRDVNILWDVVNEPVHCRVWGDWTQDGYSQNKNPEPMDRIVPYVRDAFTWAHGANPQAPLLLNDYGVLVRGSFRDRLKFLLDELRAERVPITALGIQGHEPNKGAYWHSPQELWETYDLLGRDTGLPIYITEQWYVSDPRRTIRGHHAPGHWSPELQADAVENFYRISFGHPSVKGIVYFGMNDADVDGAGTGLFDEHWQPKPAWYRLKHLIQEEWHTRLSETLPPSGLTFRGFFGTYDITVRVAGEAQRFTTHLNQGGSNHWVLTWQSAPKTRSSR